MAPFEFIESKLPIDINSIDGDTIEDFADDEYYNKSPEAQEIRVQEYVEGVERSIERYGNPTKSPSGMTFENIQILNLDKEYKIKLLLKLADIKVNGNPVKLSLPTPKSGDFSVSLRW